MKNLSIVIFLSFMICHADEIPRLAFAYEKPFRSFVKILPANPGERLHVFMMTPEKIEQGLSNGTVQIAITSVMPDKNKFQIVPFAVKGIVVAVHRKNHLRDISTEQVQMLMGQKGSWRSFNGPKARLHLYVKSGDRMPRPVMKRNHAHGPVPARTMEDFRKFEKNKEVPKKEKEKINFAKPLRLETENDFQSFSLLYTDPYGMAFFELTRYDEDRVPILKVDGIAPTLDNFKSGKYPLMETFYLAVNRKNISQCEKIMKHLLSRDFSVKLFQNGLIPLPR